MVFLGFGLSQKPSKVTFTSIGISLVPTEPFGVEILALFYSRKGPGLKSENSARNWEWRVVLR